MLRKARILTDGWGEDAAASEEFAVRMADNLKICSCGVCTWRLSGVAHRYKAAEHDEGEQVKRAALIHAHDGEIAHGADPVL